MVEMTGARAISETLRNEGINYVFGLPGTVNVPTIDSLLDYPDIRYILTVHESVAIGMADGYSRASGKPGFVNIHAMLGTAHSLGNLLNAYKDGSSLVVVAGVPDNRMQGRECFLEHPDILETVKPFTKRSWFITRADRIPEILRKAFKVATSPPTGPTYAAIPVNLTAEKADMTFIPAEKSQVDGSMRGSPSGIARAAEMLLKAENPIIMTGNEIAKYGALNELVELAELLGIPVFSDPYTTALNFPTDNPLYLGAYDRSLPTVKTADVLFGVGCKMFTEFQYSPEPYVPESTRVIHMSVDPWEIAKNIPIDLGIIADPKIGLRDIIEALKSNIGPAKARQVKSKLEMMKKARQEAITLRDAEAKKDWDATPIRGGRLIKELREVAPKAVIVNQGMTAASYLHAYYDFHEPNTYFATTGGCMGWGPSAALGVKLAIPDKPVICLVGDGTFMMGLESLWTASKYNIPVTYVVCNNYTYMAIKSTLFAYKGRAAERGEGIGVDLGNPNTDFVKLAQGFAAEGIRVEKPQDVRPALKKAISSGRTTVVDVIMDPKDTGYRRPRLP